MTRGYCYRSFTTTLCLSYPSEISESRPAIPTAGHSTTTGSQSVMIPTGLRALRGTRPICSICAQRSILRPVAQPWRLAQRRWKSDDKPSGQEEPVVWDLQKAQEDGTDAPMDVPFRKKSILVEEPTQQTEPNPNLLGAEARPAGASSWTPEIPVWKQMQAKPIVNKDTFYITTPIFYVNACEYSFPGPLKPG